MAKKKGFMSKLIEGPERSENYARSTLPSNRWQLGWDIMKNNFSKIVILNLIMLVFALPVVALMIWRSMVLKISAMDYPFESFMSYPYVGNLAGAAEAVNVSANMWLILLPVCAAVLAVGLSGVLYILRNMVWTEGVFVGSDFWRGVKKNYLIVFMITLVYSIFLFMGITSIGYSDYLIAMGEGSAFWLTVAKVFTTISIVFITLVAMHMLTMSVTYELGFFKLARNAFILSFSLIPSNLFFMAFSLVNVLLYLISPIIGVIVMILIGMAGGLLVWSVYSHWIYDKFINERVPGAKRNRGIYEKVDKESFGDDLAAFNHFDSVYLNKRPVKPITDYDVEIMELPTSFNREDLRKLEESKQHMREDSDRYVNDVLSGKIKPEDVFAKFKETEVEADGEQADNGEETAENTQE